MTKAEIAASKLAAWQASLKNQAARFYALENNKRNKTAQELQSVVSQLNHQLKNKCNHAHQRVHIIHLTTKISLLKQEIESGLYILEFSPPPVGGEKNQRVWRWGRKFKGEKREKKEIWGKYNFLQY